MARPAGAGGELVFVVLDENEASWADFGESDLVPPSKRCDMVVARMSAEILENALVHFHADNRVTLIHATESIPKALLQALLMANRQIKVRELRDCISIKFQINNSESCRMAKYLQRRPES